MPSLEPCGTRYRDDLSACLHDWLERGFVAGDFQHLLTQAEFQVLSSLAPKGPGWAEPTTAFSPEDYYHALMSAVAMANDFVTAHTPLPPRIHLDNETLHSPTLRRINALKQKAQHTPYPDEANACIDKAAALEQQLFTQHSTGGHTLHQYVVTRLYLSQPYLPEQFQILRLIVRHKELKLFIRHRQGIVDLVGPCALLLPGYAAIIQSCQLLLDQGHTLAQHYGFSHSSYRQFREGFALGFVKGLKLGLHKQPASTEIRYGLTPRIRGKIEGEVHGHRQGMRLLGPPTVG